MPDDQSATTQLGQGLYWQDLKQGNCFRTLRRTVTETDLVSFVSATGMLEAIFIDAGFEGAIAGRPVPGALTLGLIEGLQFQTLIQMTGLALLELHVTACLPVEVGHTIYGLVEIGNIVPTSKHGRAVVTSQVDIYNQADQKVMFYMVKRLIAGRPHNGLVRNAV